MWGKPRIAEETIQCSLVKAPIVFLEPIARQKIQLLMNEYPHQEWLAYLRGKMSERENIFVENISVPPHKEAFGASAEAEPFHIPKDCVGIIHSHHSMGAFHSATDQAYVDKNFPVSITVAKNGDTLTYDAVSFVHTPCGKDTTLKSTVKYVQPPLQFDRDGFLKRAKDNIDKSKTVYKPLYEPHQRYGGLGSYVPMKYRIHGLGDVVTDASGRVLSPTEIDDMLHNSEPEE